MDGGEQLGRCLSLDCEATEEEEEEEEELITNIETYFRSRN
jgi:hypothetical protein